jgi:hypothetical protein
MTTDLYTVNTNLSSAALTLADIAATRQWVAWQQEMRSEKKPTKVPYIPFGYGRAASNKPNHWGTRAQAEQRAQSLEKPYGLGGIGIMFGVLGDGTNLGGIDLDTCRDKETGRIDDWALDIVRQFDSYTEVSPSGTGVKIFFRVTVEDAALVLATKGKTKFSGDREAGHPPSIELYLHTRYFAVTDQMLTGSTLELRVVPAQTIIHLLTVTGPAFLAAQPGASGVKASTSSKVKSGTTARKDKQAPTALTPYDDKPSNFAPNPDGVLLADLHEVLEMIATADYKLRQLAPPTAGLVVAALELLPNNGDMDRDAWVEMNHAVVGCILGGEITGSVDKDDALRIRDAAYKWSCKWPGADKEVEAVKRAEDWETRTTAKLGWPYIRRLCVEAGLNDILMAEAQYEFPALEPAPDVEDTPEPVVNPEKRKSRVQFLTLNEIANLPPLNWLVDDLVPAASFVSPYGSPKAGKTFIMLSMLLHVAAGRDWMGRKTKQGAVVYIVGEGARGLKARLEAMREQYGIGDGAPFYVVSRAVNFTKAEAVVNLEEDIRELMMAEGQTLAAVAIDTVARAMPGADENAAKEMGGFISCCDHLRERLNCTVFAIHHAGKDTSRGARGSNALLGAVDAEYLIERKDQVTTLTVTDMRDGASGEVLTFDMLKIGTSDGKGSLVPVIREAPSSKGAAPPVMAKLSGDQELLMNALEEALKTSGQDQDGTRICTVKVWRALYYGRRSGDELEAMQKGFKRARDALIAKSRIEVRDPYVWIRTAWSEAGEFSATEVHELNGVLMTAPPTSDAIN